MVEHLQHHASGGNRAAKAHGRVTAASHPRGCRNAQYHKAHVIDGRIRHQPLEVALPICGERAEHNRDHRQKCERRSGRVRFLREERQHQPKEAISAQLQQHAGQNHRAGRGRLGVRIRQPGVEGPQRHLDGERHHKRPKCGRAHAGSREVCEQFTGKIGPHFQQCKQIEAASHQSKNLNGEQQT